MLRPKITATCDALLSLGAGLAGTEMGSALAAGKLVLAPTDGDQTELPRSTLNNDGSPLQLCVSSSRSRRTVRLLGDPTGQMTEPAHADGLRRFERARRALWALLDFADCEDLRPLCDRVLQILLPADAESMAGMAGPLWLAAGLGCPGVAVYVNARRGPIEEQWARVTNCLRVTAPGDEAIRMIEAVKPHALPASVGLEGTGPDDARVKVYWRLRRATALNELGWSLYLDHSLAQFLDLAVGQRPIRVSGLVFGMGFAVADGQLRDVKIDVCGHCLRLSVQEWLEVMARVTTSNGLVEMGTDPALRSGAVEVALLGFGVDALGQRRMNLYLKYPSV